VQEKDVLTLHAELEASANIAADMAGRGPKASPLARAVASDAGLDLTAVTGSGTGGRITADDVRAAGEVVGGRWSVVSEETASPSLTPNTQSPIPAPPPTTDHRPLTTIPITGLRKRVADNLMRSVREKPHVTLNLSADMTGAIQLRKDLLPVIEKKTGVRLSPTDIIVKASAVALTEFPYINAHIEGDSMTLFAEVNVGLAVSLGDEGLIVPVIRDVARKGLAQIAADRNELVERARSGKLGSADITGGTFTVTNLGNYGIEAFNPIIPPPQVAILGVGAIADTVVARNGAPTVRPMMGLSLSFDHRAVDGAPAAAFLARLKEILETPTLLLV
jgi:pyruvate dehydrogenase E2 component (dihydrolipoamide acetyltransferase)